MKTIRLLPAAALLSLAAMSALLWLAADLGVADARLDWTQATEPLRVYATGEVGAPALTQALVDRWDARLDTACALPIRDVPAELAGPGWSAAVTLRAVPLGKLPLTGMTLIRGTWPGSAWESEALLSAQAEAVLSRAVRQAGYSLPERVKLYIGGREACKAAGVVAADVRVSGTAAESGGVSEDAVVWVDSDFLDAFARDNESYSKDRSISSSPVHADIYPRRAGYAPEVAEDLTDQGFLVVNPIKEWDEMLQTGRDMCIRWGVLAALLAAAALYALRRHPVEWSLGRTLAFSAAACAVGLLLAVAIIQTAMLLSWNFFTASAARYLMSLPRIFAVASACIAIAFGGAIRIERPI